MHGQGNEDTIQGDQEGGAACTLFVLQYSLD